MSTVGYLHCLVGSELTSILWCEVKWAHHWGTMLLYHLQYHTYCMDHLNLNAVCNLVAMYAYLSHIFLPNCWPFLYGLGCILTRSYCNVTILILYPFFFGTINFFTLSFRTISFAQLKDTQDKKTALVCKLTVLPF